MITTFRYILLTSVRDRLMIGLIAALVGAALIGAFLGDASFMEERQMALAYAGFSTRLVLILGLILFVCFHVQRSYDNREIDLMLSRPISRTQFVLIYWAGFSGLALALSLVASIVLPIAGMPDRGGFAMWVLSLALEATLIVAIALFFSLTIRAAVGSAMATLAFYLLARMAGFLLGIAQADWSELTTTAVGTFLAYGVYLVGLILPRLDLFGQTWWLNYGVTDGDAVWPILAQTAVYVPLLLVAAIFDFRRKRF